MADRKPTHDIPSYADPALQPKQKHGAEVYVPIERFSIEGHRPPCDRRCTDTRMTSPDGFTVRLGHEIDCGPRGLAGAQNDIPAFASEAQKEAAWQDAIRKAHHVKATGGSARSALL